MPKTPNRMIYPPIDFTDGDETASALGTTGMMPVLPGTVEEYASFQELAGMGIPTVLPVPAEDIPPVTEPDDVPVEPEEKR